MANWQAFVGISLAAFAGAGNALGGWLVARHFRAKPELEFSDGRLNSLSALTQIGAGILLAVTIMEFIPTALDTVHPRAWAAPLVLFGYLLVHLAEHGVVPHLHADAGASPDSSISPTAVYSAVVGLSVHALFDGIAIGAAAHLSRSLGWLVFGAILSHKIPVGATVTSIALTAGMERRKAFLASVLLGAATPLGALLVFPLTPAQMGMAFGVGAGVMLYVSATELIPAENKVKNIAVPCRVIVGVCLFAATEYLLKMAGLE